MIVLSSAGPTLPIEPVGWAVLILSLLFAVAWIAGVYR